VIGTLRGISLRQSAKFEEALRFLGIVPDEWWLSGGPNAPYAQSERLPRYREIASLLISEDKAYRCYCTEDRLREMRERQSVKRRSNRIRSNCRESLQRGSSKIRSLRVVFGR